MILTKIHSAPSLESFIPLADHQSHTPTSFYQTRPVLYYHDNKARALIKNRYLSRLPIFTASSSENEIESTFIQGIVEVFVSSENLIFFNDAIGVGFAIPYPAITLHAIQRLEDPLNSSLETQGLYMQIESSDCQNNTEVEDDDTNYIDLTLISSPNSDSTKNNIQPLFEAVSACSDLHPDPIFEEDGILNNENGLNEMLFEGDVEHENIDGLPGVYQGAMDNSLPPPFPGSGGWITAENLSQYLDERGNWMSEISSTNDKIMLG